MKQRLYKANSLLIIMILVAMLVTLGSIAYVKHEKGTKPFPQLSDDYVLGNSFQSETLGAGLNKNGFAELLQAQSKHYFFAAAIGDSYAVLHSQDIRFPNELLEGRGFAQEDFQKKRNVAVINEKAKASCAMKKGKPYWRYAGKDYAVIGVYKAKDAYGNEKADAYINYLASNLDNTVLNSMFTYDTGKNSVADIDAIAQKATKAFPGMDIQYAKNDTSQSENFRTYTVNFDSMMLLLLATVILIFLNAFIACGNWIEGKRKEIAVRKLVGAKTRKIVQWIVSEFLFLVAVAFAIGLALSKAFLLITPHLPVAKSTLLMFGDTILWSGVLLGLPVVLFLGLLVVGISLRRYNKREIVRNIR